MARYRKVYPRIWHDEDFAKLTTAQKAVALYILTCPQSNRIGLFRLGFATSAADLDMVSRDFVKTLDTVCHTLSWVVDTTTETVFLPSWWRWNRPENMKALKGYLSDLDELPRTRLISLFANNLNDLPEAMRDTVCHTLERKKRSCAQEQEQEQEQEQDIKPPTPLTKKVVETFDEVDLPPELGNGFRDVWRAWCRHRREIKKPLTATAVKEQLAKLAAIGAKQAEAAVRHSIANGWQGVFQPKAGDIGHKPEQRKHITLAESRQALKDKGIDFDNE